MNPCITLSPAHLVSGTTIFLHSLIIRDDDLQGVFLHGIAKRIVCLHDLVQREMVGNQLLGLDLARHHRFQKHGGRHRINQPRGEGDIV